MGTSNERGDGCVVFLPLVTMLLCGLALGLPVGYRLGLQDVYERLGRPEVTAPIKTRDLKVAAEFMNELRRLDVNYTAKQEKEEVVITIEPTQ